MIIKISVTPFFNAAIFALFVSKVEVNNTSHTPYPSLIHSYFDAGCHRYLIRVEVDGYLKLVTVIGIEPFTRHTGRRWVLLVGTLSKVGTGDRGGAGKIKSWNTCKHEVAHPEVCLMILIGNLNKNKLYE